MSGSDENYHCVIRPSNNVQGGLKPVSGKMNAHGNGRRALSTIDKNIISAPSQHNPCNKKGVLTERNAGNKNPVIPANRPVTRRYAAQLSGKRQKPSPEDQLKPHKDPIFFRNESKDCIILDADEDNMVDVPMFVQHTEAMMEEIDRMDAAEIEMEDVDSDDESTVDIDTSDKNDPLAVTEYIDEIYSFYKKTENSSRVPPNYMAQQFDVNERMRAILIDWLIEVHYKFELMEETLYLTVNLIDRFLAAHPVVRKKLQLVGVTALLLACKYEEISVPVVEDLILISDKAYSRKEVLDMEKLMVNTLQFNLSTPTPYVFMRRFLKAAQSDKQLEMLSFYIVELCLVDYKMLQFPPSLLAAAAIFTAQCTLNGNKQWSKTSEKHTTYTEEDLMESSMIMVTLHQKAATEKLTAVHKKYSLSKYGYAAEAIPAVFLLDG